MVLLLVFALAAAFACIVAITFLSVRQNGRILLRLEAIEQRLAALSGGQEPAVAQGLTPGTKAPPFELPSLDGGTLAFPGADPTRTVLVFFDPTCGFCRKMAPQLAELNDRRDPGVVLVTSGEPEATRALLAEHSVRLPVAIQPRRDISLQYDVTGTPMGYLIDEQGVIASELAIGAPAVLRLAGASAGQPTAHKGHKPISASRILRTGLQAGTPAPAFRLPRLDGGELSLAEYRGQRLLLVLSDPQCGPCMKLAPRLEDYHRRHGDPRILLVSRGDEAENRQKAVDLRLTFPIVLQRQWEISREYGIFSTPVAFLIDEQGTIVHNVAVGADAVLALLKETPVIA